MNNWIFTILVGGIAGWLASLVMGTGDRMGCLLNIVVGVVGGIVGNWIFRELGWIQPEGNWVGPIVVAFVGATVLLAGLRLISRR